jgi:predicted membrane protein
MSDEATMISRGTTGKRILFTILFMIIFRLVGVVLVLVILFELLFSLITKEPPSERVTRFAHRMVRYGYEIGQYVTYNKEQQPFPFDDFPNDPERVDVGSSAAT